MIDIMVKNVKVVVRPGRTRAELDLTDADTRVSWGHGLVVEQGKGLYGTVPAAFNLITRGVRYAQPRIVKALAPVQTPQERTATLYISEEGGSERCRFAFD